MASSRLKAVITVEIGASERWRRLDEMTELGLVELERFVGELQTSGR